MKLRADVEFDELLKYGFKKENVKFLGCDHVFIRYRYSARTKFGSSIEIIPFDINGKEDRNIFVIDDIGGSIDDKVLDKLYELITSGLIEAPKPILPAPKPLEIDEETFTRFWTMMRGALEKSLEVCRLVVKPITNDEKDKEE